MRDKMERMQREMEDVIMKLREELSREMIRRAESRNALIPVRRIPVRKGE
jgi:hypothetical protein